MPAKKEERASQTHKRSKSFKTAQKRLGLRVRQLRQEQELTLEAAAERTKLDLKHLQRIESGQTNVTLVTLARLADGFKVALADLFPNPAGK